MDYLIYFVALIWEDIRGLGSKINTLELMAL